MLLFLLCFLDNDLNEFQSRYLEYWMIKGKWEIDRGDVTVVDFGRVKDVRLRKKHWSKMRQKFQRGETVLEKKGGISRKVESCNQL